MDRLGGLPSGTSGPQEATGFRRRHSSRLKSTQHPLSDSSFPFAFQTSIRMVRDSYSSHWLTSWPGGIARGGSIETAGMPSSRRPLCCRSSCDSSRTEDTVPVSLWNYCWLDHLLCRSCLLFAAWPSRPTSLRMRRSEFAQTISHAPFRHVGSDPFALSWRALWNRQFKSLKTSLRRPDSCTIVHFYVYSNRRPHMGSSIYIWRRIEWWERGYYSRLHRLSIIR